MLLLIDCKDDKSHTRLRFEFIDVADPNEEEDENIFIESWLLEFPKRAPM